MSSERSQLTIRAAWVLLTLLTACRADAHPLHWGVHFRTEAERAQARYVEASILEGSCDGRVLFSAEVPLSGSGTMRPMALPAGSYAVRGRARNESCHWYVEGCRELTLPTEVDPFVVTLDPGPGEAACTSMECTEGRCTSDDAGMPDATAPDGAMDALPDAPPDTAMDARPDTNVRDSGRDSRVDSGWDTGSWDTSTEDTSVPGCGSSCAVGEQYCTGGSCECRPELDMLSDGSCTILRTDPNNCGSEGRACDTGSEVTCRSGTCEDRCTTTMTNCSNHCVDITTDPRHCGGCDMPCAPNAVCVGGSCRTFTTLGCSACPCGGCSGQCCDYGSLTICVGGGASACP